MSPATAHAAPIVTPVQHVKPEWIDDNAHMNVAYYALAFDLALDAVSSMIGVGWAYTQAGRGTTFVLESHISYVREVVEGDPLRITFQLLDWDAKRMHFMEEMFHGADGYLAAASEQILTHVDTSTRRPAPFPAQAQAHIAAIGEAHRRLRRPSRAGRVIGIRRAP